MCVSMFIQTRGSCRGHARVQYALADDVRHVSWFPVCALGNAKTLRAAQTADNSRLIYGATFHLAEGLAFCSVKCGVPPP